MIDRPIIGIDLGTTNSLAAWVPAVEPVVVPGRSRAIVPSVVSREGDRWIVGDAARARRLTHPTLTVFSAKRFIGKSIAEIEDLTKDLPFNLLDDSGTLKIQVGDGAYAPAQISAEILRLLRERASEHLDTDVRHAVITVPAYFDDVQRSATRAAAEIAGLEVLRLINEPTAAALAYGLDDRDRGNVVVFDLGGGTFDVSVLKIEDGVFQVLSTAGDTLLGGDDFDELLMGFLSQVAGDSKDPLFLQNLRKIAEQGKIALSSHEAVDLVVDLSNGQSVERRFSRSEFENSIKPLIDRTIESCRQALQDAALEASAIDEVILVGGSTRIPYVQQRVRDFFGVEPHSSLNPDEVVALGAAVQGHILSGGSRELLLLDVTPLSLGLEIVGGGMSRIIHRNSSIPCEASDEFTTSVDNQTGLDLHILQGERELADHNRSLGKYRLTGFPGMPAGIPKFMVTFRLDASGQLQVTALEERSGADLDVVLKPNRGLTESDIEQMKREAIDNSKEDLQAIRAINITNEAGVVLRTSRKAIDKARKDLPEGLSHEDLDAMTEVADRLEAAITTRDIVMVEFTHEELNELTSPLADHLISGIARQIDAP